MLKWFSRKPQGAVVQPPKEVSPASPLSVIGDIHGRMDLLERLLAESDEGSQLICVGDYVDRGDDSADVLRALFQRPDIVCLRGNHEEMMLSFIDKPETSGSRWMRYGGLQTIASFGVGGVHEFADGAAMRNARDELVNAMGDELIEWLRRLPSHFISGNVAVVHAGADPDLPIDDQPLRNLTWGHANFGARPRFDQMWVVHGHTIVDEPSIVNGCVAIDTGAYATGRLSYVRVTTSGFTFC